MYVAARQLSLPSVDAYIKELERVESLDDPKVEHSLAMNKLIDKYFLFDGETDLLETLSIKEDVQDILPLNHFDSA